MSIIVYEQLWGKIKRARSIAGVFRIIKKKFITPNANKKLQA